MRKRIDQLGIRFATRELPQLHAPGAFVKSVLRYVTFCFALVLPLSVHAQTFEINGQQQNPPQQQSGKKGSRSLSQPAPSSGIGWGSSIEVGRFARAAETALSKGDSAGAANYAERAVQAAPQDAKLWYLLGYTTRLAGRYDRSLQAFQRGLQLQPGSVEGLSGMAQTYAR